MSKIIIDSSTLIALEHSNLLLFLKKLDHEIILPKVVEKEVNKSATMSEMLKNFDIMQLKGKTLKLKQQFLETIDEGEAECCALAINLDTGFIVCDDRKFLRQRFFSHNVKLKQLKVVGFSFLLHEFYKKKLIKDVWQEFEKIIITCNWERSEVQIANYTFLKELGY